MKYELALQLKELGFPIGNSLLGIIPNNTIVEVDDDYGWRNHEDHNTLGDEHTQFYKDVMYLPTLSELIEACGNGMRILLKDSTNWDKKIPQWGAGIPDGEDFKAYIDEYYPHGYGYTPEEAVAKLLLELNKK